MTTFERELNALIRKHLGRPKWGDDFCPILDALRAATDRLDGRADRYRFRDESKQEFKQYQREWKRRQPTKRRRLPA
jgi:hypothetical protein